MAATYSDDVKDWEQSRRCEEIAEVCGASPATVILWKTAAKSEAEVPYLIPGLEAMLADTSEVEDDDDGSSLLDDAGATVVCVPCLNLEGEVTPEKILLREFYGTNEFANQRTRSKPAGYIVAEVPDVNDEADPAELLACVQELEAVTIASRVLASADLSDRLDEIVERVQERFTALYEQAKMNPAFRATVEFFEGWIRRLNPAALEPVTA